MHPHDVSSPRIRLRGAVEFANVLIVLLVALGALGWWWYSRDARPGSRTPSASSVAAMGPLEPETNRRGRDLFEAGTRAGSAADCSSMCLTTEACQAMSFAKTGASDGTGICWLKGSVPEAADNPSMVSAVKLKPRP